MASSITVRGLMAWYGKNHVLKGIDLDIPAGSVLAIIGPSGCGKSTFIRCLNRLHEEVEGARVQGAVTLNGTDIFALDTVELRRRVGMVFQRPNPFPTRSVYGNVAAGLTLGGAPRRQVAAAVEQSLKAAALWDEVSGRLHSPAVSLSGGQQQRLCIARALAVDPEVLLMDEPCSALDPASTLRVEDLIRTLRGRYTVVLVTHNMQQAARVADLTAFFLNGELIEHGATDVIFTRPSDRRTEDYITGRFG